MAKSRNLIIGCDGTWNDTHEEASTNVIKIIDGCMARNQVTHYEEGVGTAHWEALPGGIYGKGLDRQILGGYRFLRKRFSDSDWNREENKVFIFGFSRGAYAARRLAGLLDFCGVPSTAADLELAWHLYLQQDKDSVDVLKGSGRLFEIPIEMVGVWDTVKTTTDKDFGDHKLPGCVGAGYHAMAIDEKRKFFKVLRWSKDERVNQTWFSGVHSDVGGGYNETGLSDIALKWMIDKAYGHGMKCKVSAVNALTPQPGGEQHNSYDGIWKPFGINIRSIAPTAAVHISVQERLEEVPEYTPKNLPPDPEYVT